MSHLVATGLGCRIARRRVLHGIDLAVRPGEMVAVVGTNGAGKSTLIRTLAGLLRFSEGSVLIDGEDLASMGSRDRAQRIGYVAQDESPTAELCVQDVVALGLVPRRAPWAVGRTDEDEVVRHALAAVDLADHAGQRCAHLSGGEQRRVLLARAMAQDTDLLLLDEPSNHLDVQQQDRLLKVLRATGSTVVAAMHDLPLTVQHFDRVAVLHEGRLAQLGDPWSALAPEVIRQVYGLPAVHLDDPTTGRRHLVLGAGADVAIPST